MNRIKLLIIGLLVFWLSGTDSLAQDRLTGILKQEMEKQMRELKDKEYPPYYMNYRVIDEYSQILRASSGALTDKSESVSSVFVPQLRLGSAENDNFKYEDMGSRRGTAGASIGKFPIYKTDNEDAIRETIWETVCERYEYALEMIQKKEVKEKLTVKSEDPSPCFSAVRVERHYEDPLSADKMKLDEDVWGKRLEEISAVFKKYPHIIEGDATLTYKVVRNYFVSSEGAEVVHNLVYTRMIVMGMVIAEDGMLLPLNQSYFSFTPDGLPDNAQIIKETEELARRLEALRHAPVAKPYHGPVMLSGAASGVFFHEIFGHRVEGQRMRNEMDGQTFKKMIGKLVLPESFQVYDDPSLKQFDGQDLNGYYQYDDQGVKGQRVNVVVDGKMNDFLMTRKPMEGFSESNGHARAMGAFDPVSRQSNLVIETEDYKSEAELRELLLKEVKSQGLEYGYYFNVVNGGFTNTSVRGISSFNVAPLEAFRIYADGRPDELIRGIDIIGTPLAMFSGIIYAGGESEVFTGMCGAESGWVPVTSVSPAIVVKKVETQTKAKSKMQPPVMEKPMSGIEGSSNYRK